MSASRIIGTYEGKDKGPLFVSTGGIHGNETAGVEALGTVFTLLERESLINPDFSFRGRFIGLKGNIAALAKQERYLDQDMNRIWVPEKIAANSKKDPSRLSAEEKELLDILSIVRQEIDQYQPERLVWLDLHTTTAGGGIFSISDNRKDSLEIATGLHAPVITGMLDSLQGTLMHYVQDDNLGIPSVSVTFEAGQHKDPLSVNRAIAALINCLRATKMVPADIVENRHDKLLIEYSQNLPKLARLIHIHHIRPGDDFHMMPNYENFMPVKKGELLAHDRFGPIYAPHDSLILMPLYQKQGSEGYFLLSTVVSPQMAQISQ